MAVGVWPFVKLKLRITANGLRGRPARVTLFVVGAFAATVLAVLGYAGFALPGLLGDERAAGMLLPFGGALLVLGWLFLPLLFFGVDESLDPARFALLPLRRRTLIAGLGVAALAGLPALATLTATAGMVDTATRLGGPLAGLAEALGVTAGLLLCVTLSRAVTSAFATALRSRRARDLATIMLAVVAASVGPLQLLLLGLLNRADWDNVAAIATVAGWTPLGAPYSMGLDVVAGRAWAVPIKLVIVLAAVGGLVWWWSRTLEQAMAGTATSGGRGPAARADGRGPVDQLMFRWWPRTRFGALVARETRYWWRENRRRAGLVALTMAGLFLPLTSALGPVTGMAGGMAFLVGAIAPVALSNQFGYDGSAYATNLSIGIPGRLEIHSRAAAHALFTVPLLVLVAVLAGVISGQPARIPAHLGTLFAVYGTGLALMLPISVRAAYALPESTGPFAVTSGGGLAKGLPSLAGMIGGLFGALPVVLAGYLLGTAWTWAGLPIGLGYGAAAYLVGSGIAGDLLDRRMPEVLAAVTPR
ncbi:ABC transporter permease [Actinoplanes awajinensis]|uniref:ABC transporter permease n=1 Tax=Actinoplanes awajinensis subsp. mycoplanecinus TaxID=135947 RepID=A0A0X3UPE5_9ACTN|nr:ABC transporter permease [Actinoplanes awajinensis]KUL34459.1 ABC transporter permease [Actinoplanes awajinensis subsp. mycoplanecinus]